MPEQMTIAQFGQTIKAKHPEYADMADDDVGTKVLAKYPQYQDMVQSGPNFSSLTAQPDAQHGQGTYAMWDNAGHKLDVPYGNVPQAAKIGAKFDTNPNQAGLTPAQQFQKDYNFANTGPGHEAEYAQSDKNAPLPVQAISGVVKGIGTIGKPVMDLVGAAGRVPQESIDQSLTAQTPTELAGKSAMLGVATVPAAIVAPAATAGALAAGTAGGMGAGAIANAAGASPRASALISDAAGLAAGTAGGIGASRLAPLGLRAAGRLITGDINKPIPGFDVTPLQRYTTMKEMGINPDAAEATNSGLLDGIKRLNQNSLTASPLYKRTQAANLNALHDYTSKTLDTMSPLSPEEGGALVQKGLLKSHADLKTGATEAFQKLDDEVGGQPIPGADQVKKMAQEILNENAPYYKLHPELEPTKAMSIVRDLAKQGSEPIKRPPNTVTGFGPPSAMPGAAPPQAITYSELHRLRSDLLDFNNTNPDLVKNQANGWISRLAGAADEAITSGESGLTSDQVDTFRNANSAWKMMKDTYDNPQSPFYHAVRTASPSTLIEGISRTPEHARLLGVLLGPDEIGAIQRGVTEKMLGRTPEGNYNFKTFGGKFSRQLSPSYQKALFTPAQLEQLRNIGRTGGVLNTDLNPSGTAKEGLKQKEMYGLVAGVAALPYAPLALPTEIGYHAGQFGVSRLMNNSNFVNLLMLERAVNSSAR